MMYSDLTEQMKHIFQEHIGERVTPELLEVMRQGVLTGLFEFIDKNSVCTFDPNTGGVKVTLPETPREFILKAENKI